MPTLDEAPKLETLSAMDLASFPDENGPTEISANDLVLVYDISTGKPKAITVSALMSTGSPS